MKILTLRNEIIISIFRTKNISIDSRFTFLLFCLNCYAWSRPFKGTVGVILKWPSMQKWHHPIHSGPLKPSIDQCWSMLFSLIYTKTWLIVEHLLANCLKLYNYLSLYYRKAIGCARAALGSKAIFHPIFIAYPCCLTWMKRYVIFSTFKQILWRFFHF